MARLRRGVKVLAAAMVVAMLVGGCSGRSGRGNKESEPVLTVRGAGDLSVTRGPKPPAEGVWMGAWVRPTWETPGGRIDAFRAFEDQVGAPMAIAHEFHDWNDEFPNATEREMLYQHKLLLISWAGTDTRSITSGVYDHLIRQRAERIKEFGAPVLFRFRWEMDRPNLSASVHSPSDYIAAWRHVRGIFTEVNATNAAWVWCPHVLGFVDETRNAPAYYPGDDQVDWLCADIYTGRDFKSFSSQADKMMAFASKHPRPIIVGEFGVTAKGDPGQRAAWLAEARTYVRAHPQIKAMVYFASWDDGKNTYDSTFNNDPEGLAAFREMVADPYFRPRLPPLEAK